ncbi:hypothetical protein A2Z22_00250 [Candidatus Woesebacteria bacterium RBG_16_34_12]|uniref:Sulfatase N-terminal domain-containing protein n=1 Tax=Candidatus Woesebacteria bacterium RBG_16_34_12 TaxID=1802480 RepID=A0A1F7X8V7_9BACT|nr:MAG: hypothetical protein A2Z22_00250 [Candidatus Woesebacteria bacterium RBG_16_34_12]
MFIGERILKNWIKVGILLTVFIFLFYLLIPLANTLTNITIFSLVISKYKFLALIEGSLFLTITFYVVSTKRDFKLLNSFLNIFTLLLLFFIASQIISYKVKQDSYIMKEQSLSNIFSAQAMPIPDIYYIILDGHARSDILKEIYDYDVNELIKNLENKGFYIATKSTTNYIQTYLSLASSLNFEYLDSLFGNLSENSTDRILVRNKLKNNKVYDFLKQRGYTFITYNSNTTGVDSKADINIKNPGGFSEFESVFLRQTPLLNILGGGFTPELYSNAILSVFDNIPETAKNDLPTFTYAHIMSPHPPFVFNQNGEIIKDRSFKNDPTGDGSSYIGSADYINAYRDQVIFIDKKILELVDNILSSSISPPIIILQADHGSGSRLNWESWETTYLKERIGIFSAFYFPDQDYSKLYDSITPVNTFRVIFNKYFNSNFELLPDKNYFSTWSKPYKFIEVTEKVMTE